MKRIAIIGGGISGLTAAYELEKARKAGAALDWHLYEASDRLGGIVETTRQDGFVLEGGPDAWISEKPWARDLAIELGLEDELIYSNDATRKTYILLDGKLQPIPDRMRLMVPEDLAALEGSPLFSGTARAAYAAELARAEALRFSSPVADASYDESVAAFTLRHFGDEVLTKLAAPLLAGVFGGDVHKLSVRAVMPQFVALEQSHGSLIAGLAAKRAARGDKPQQPIFTSLRNGMASLTEALTAALPQERLHSRTKVECLWDDPRWQLIVVDPQLKPADSPHPLLVDTFDHVVFASSIETTRSLLSAVDYDKRVDKLLPVHASSAILVAFAWQPITAASFKVPPGFGILVPPQNAVISTQAQRSGVTHSSSAAATETPLLAATFVDQKFNHRAPERARVIRAFFGGASAEALANATDVTIARAAHQQLNGILGELPPPDITTVRRWPNSLPQYEVGHLDRIAKLDALVDATPGLTLLGNSYRGVGLPDLIRDARNAAAKIVSEAGSKR